MHFDRKFLMSALIVALSITPSIIQGISFGASLERVQALWQTETPILTSTEISRMQKEAESGNMHAQAMLGIIYHDGRGVPKDLIKAFYWIEKGANQGSLGAQILLACMYRDGEGTSVDNKKAFYWVKKAAEQGEVESQLAVGRAYFEGTEGTIQNYGLAYYWLHRASMQGNSAAQSIIGLMCRDGIGTPRDYIQAYMWFNLSASEGGPGDEVVRNFRDKLANQMTMGQIYEAQRLTREWKPVPEPASSITIPAR